MFFGQECTKVIVGIDWGQPSPSWKKKIVDIIELTQKIQYKCILVVKNQLPQVFETRINLPTLTPKP